MPCTKFDPISKNTNIRRRVAIATLGTICACYNWPITMSHEILDVSRRNNLWVYGIRRTTHGSTDQDWATEIVWWSSANNTLHRWSYQPELLYIWRAAYMLLYQFYRNECVWSIQGSPGLQLETIISFQIIFTKHFQ